MLLMVEKGIRGGICHAIHQYATANNEYMRKHSKDKESSYLTYWDANNLYGWTILKNYLQINLNGKNKQNLMKSSKKFMT